MPTVPTYMPGSGSNQTVTSQGQASPDSFGAVQAQQISQAGQAGLGIGREMLDQATQLQDITNRAKVRDAVAQAQNSALDYVADNVLSKKGQDAIGSMDSTTQALQQQQQSYSGSLDNPAQKQMFNQIAPMVYNHAIEMARRHVVQQTFAFNTDTLTASKAAAVNAAVTDYNNPQSIAEAEATIQADNNSLYHGMPVEAAANTQSEISTLHTNVATAMAANDPVAAANYIRQNKNKILPAQYDKVNQDIDNRVVTTGALKTANTLSALDPQQALATANTIQDPETRQLTLAALQSHFNVKNAADALNSADQDADNVSTILSDPGNAAANLPADLPAAQRTQLIQAANDRVTAMQNGQPIASDPKVYTSLIRQAATDPDGFLRRPLTPYLSQLSDSDWNSITSIRSELAKKRDGAQDKAFSLDNMNTMFNNAIRGVPELSTDDATGKPLKPGPELQQRMRDINLFRDDFTNRVNTQLPTPAQRIPENAQNILDQMLARHVTDKAWGLGDHWYTGFGLFGGNQQTLPQGMVDENPILDHTTSSWSKGLNLEPTTFNGNPAYVQYNSDRTGGTIYDPKTGKPVRKF